MIAEIIAIGTELLLGEIVDTNSAHIAKTLRGIGVDVFFQTTVGDNVERAAEAIRIALSRSDIVITTGGLGPTVDDITREAVAEATGRTLEFRPELLQQIAQRFRRWGTTMSENNRRQAYSPQGALGIENPVGTAPCFALEGEEGVIISLPGVPREMMYLMENSVIPYLITTIDSAAVIHSLVLRTAGVGESYVDSLIGDLETMANPTVGLAAHAGQTDIRITAKASSLAEAEKLIAPVAEQIRQRLGDSVYGEEKTPLEAVVGQVLRQRDLRMNLAECGTGELGTERLLGVAPSVVQQTHYGETWQDLMRALEPHEMACDTTSSLRDKADITLARLADGRDADVLLVVLVEPGEDGKPRIAIGTQVHGVRRSSERGFGGPPEHAATLAITYGFDRIRRQLLKPMSK